MVTIRTSEKLLEHLRTFEHDGATVDSLLFEGGRLAYPGRKEIEYQLGYTEPYTIDLEARVIEGMPPRMAAAIRVLCREAEDRVLFSEQDPTLELLWRAHGSWRGEGVSLDRLVCALVAVELSLHEDCIGRDFERAAEILVRGFHALGFPLNPGSLEELFDGAPPACVGLGLVEL